MTVLLAIISAVLLVAGVLAFLTVIKNTYVCDPNEVLILSGRRWFQDGREIGFRVVRGGRAFRMPVIEVVDRLELSAMQIDLSVANAYSKGGIPLHVQATANVKIPGDAPLLYNTIERFLGRTTEEIKYVVKETLEGNLRGVIAQLTPEEINGDKTRFQQILVEEGERDLHGIGLVLDNLKLQNVADEVGYLDSIGRIRAADVRRTARIGEVSAQADSAVNEAKTWMQAKRTEIDVEMKIASKENQKRIENARSQREALIAEVRGQVQGQIAEARAQLQAWDARIEQVRRKLEADVIAPAEARRQQMESNARGTAAQVIAQGRASAEAIARLAEAYRIAGPRARDAMLMQKLSPVVDQLLSTMQNVRVSRMTVMNVSGSGSTQLGPSLLTANEQVKASTGVDLMDLVRERLSVAQESK